VYIVLTGFIMSHYPLVLSRLIAIAGSWRIMQRLVLAAGVFDLVENF
jgi:hypothetical protein